MSSLICIVDLPKEEAVELSDGSARYWVGTELKFEGLIDDLPAHVLAELVRLKVLIHAHYD
jgi:hypothetical protein